MTNLIITFLPELKLLEKTFGLLVGVKLAGKEMISSATLHSITRSFGAVQTAGHKLDDVINGIRGPISAKGEMDAESQARYAAYAAKNRIFSQLLERLYATLDAALVTDAFLQAMIVTHPVPGVKSIVENVLERIGLDQLPYGEIKPQDTDQSAYSLLSNLILYDMLRAYVGNYVTLACGFATTASSVRALPQYNDNIEGLDGAQRQMIYDRFGKVGWGDPRRPPVNSYKDLVLKWNAGINTFGVITKVGG